MENTCKWSKWNWLLPQISTRRRVLVANNLVASTLASLRSNGWHPEDIVDFFWSGWHWIWAEALCLPVAEGGQGLNNIHAKVGALSAAWRGGPVRTALLLSLSLWGLASGNNDPLLGWNTRNVVCQPAKRAERSWLHQAQTFVEGDLRGEFQGKLWNRLHQAVRQIGGGYLLCLASVRAPGCRGKRPFTSSFSDCWIGWWREWWSGGGASFLVQIILRKAAGCVCTSRLLKSRLSMGL